MKVNYAKHKIANLISINRIVTIHYYEFGRDFEFEGESHNFWEMVYVDKGRVKINAGSRSFYLKQGEAAFHKPNEFHSISADKITSSDVFVISFVCSSSAMAFFRNKVLTVPGNLRKNISAILEESSRTFEMVPVTGASLTIKEDAPAGSQQLIRIYLEELLIMLMRGEREDESTGFFPSKERMENHLVSKMITIIEEKLVDGVSAETMALELNYSRAYLSKIFKNFTGHTVKEYELKLKIKLAKRLIRENSLNFTQISDRLKFDNPQYFSRVFKRVTGHTPSEYKKSVL